MSSAAKGDFQIPRNSLYWLLTAQFVVIVPHLERIPAWVLGVLLICGVWRVMIFRGQWTYPPTRLRIMLVIVAMLAIVFQFRPLLGLEAMVAMLLTAFSLKLLEMRQQRDAFLVIMLGYFIIMTEFLFEQGMLVATYMVFAFIVITAAMIGLNQTRTHLRPMRTLRLALVLTAQSIPVMIVVFIMFPRVSPLWAVNSTQASATTGMSETMSPGDIAKLGQSTRVAFRATFKEPIPPRRQLYWRGLVMSEFDGRTWRRGPQDTEQAFRIDWSGADIPRFAEYFGRMRAPIRYDVILEPTGRQWLFGLAVARSRTVGVGVTADARLISQVPVTSKFRYDVVSYRDYILEPRLSPASLRHKIRIPSDGNRRARVFAEELLNQSGSREADINRVLDYFRLEPFAYTLQPPLLGENPVDQFLFETRRGFCEHYASAFAFLMRAAGIPARIVAGYQGGEYSADRSYLVVRDSDAHAWVEVWLEGRGWMRFDPTAEVSPDRIDLGLEVAAEAELDQLSPLSPLRYRNIGVINWIRLRMDLLNYYWSRMVLGYDRESQADFFSRWFGEVDWRKTTVIMVGLVSALYLLTALSLLRKRAVKKRDPVTESYLRFCRKLERIGVVRRPDEGPVDFARRAKQRLPSMAEEIDAITGDYVALAYASPEHVARDETRFRRLRQRIRQLRRPGRRRGSHGVGAA